MDMNIPYTVEARPDTGLTNGKLGIWLFLASEVMLFGALFSTYIILRIGSTVWPHGALNVPLGAVNTVLLICSSVTMVLAFLICFVFGGLLGIPALRLPGTSLALITLALALAFPQVIKKYSSVTNGVGGISTPPGLLRLPTSRLR